MNLELFDKVKKAITEEPKRLNIWDWQSRGYPEPVAPACGTVGCIAGWADILNRTEGNTDPEVIRGIELSTFTYEEGRKALGLTHEQADYLFDPASWPHDLEWKVGKTKAGSYDQSKVVCEAIDAFLKDPERFVECGAEGENFYERENTI